MDGEYHRWYSPSVGHELELLVFGWGGAPVIVFPTSYARFYEWKDNGMIEALRDKIDAGFIQVYCPDSDGRNTWYNDHIHPHDRAVRHNRWESYVSNELLPFVRSRNSNPYLITTGTSFGAYLAVNYALKNPWQIHKVVGLSGSYTIHNLLDGYFDQDCYFNSPIDYLPNLNDGAYLSRYREMEWILVTSDHDVGICQKSTLRLTELMRAKDVPVKYEFWGDQTGHDWPHWRKMIRKYL